MPTYTNTQHTTHAKQWLGQSVDKRMKDGDWRLETGEQRTENREQRTENREQRTENREQSARGGGEATAPNTTATPSRSL